MSNYRIAANVEWTSKCNALCSMCPRDAIEKPQAMSMETWQKTLARLTTEDVFRTVIAGYGEPTTHSRFHEFVDTLRAHPGKFDMVSNGHQLDGETIRHLDGAIGILIVSFSSIDPEVYRKVHVNLDQARVMANIQLAQQLFKKTVLAISLTPLPECLPSLPDTIAWLRAQGVQALTMSPTLYNRGGSLETPDLDNSHLRRLIKQHGLLSQEQDFIPSAREMMQQWMGNRFKCVPRNTDILIGANGDYLYCYNDARHAHALGNVADTSIREAIEKREEMDAIPSLCDGCNTRNFGLTEVAKSALIYGKGRIKSALQARAAA